MESTPTDARPAAERGIAPHRIPHATTPTYEIELLISGAVVFALLQLPGVVDAAFDRLSPRFGARGFSVMMYAYLYLQIVLYALIVTFVTHLAVRGYWVALVGMRSVFPQGIRWERMRYGPVVTQEARERTPTIDTMVAKVDDAASLVFGTGVLLVIMAIYSALISAVAAGLAWLIALALGRPLNMWLWGGMMAALLLPVSVVSLVDKYRSPRAEQAWSTRVLRGIYRASNVMFLSRVYGTLILTFTSNVGQRLGMLFLVLTMWLLMAAVLLGVMVRRGVVGLDEYGVLPDRISANALDARHYADRRGEEHRHAVVPFLPSEELRGRWLRLFVPFSPDRHGPVIAAKCPKVREAREAMGALSRTSPLPDDASEAQRAARRKALSEAADRHERTLLECLREVHAVRLDGVEAEADLLIHRDAVSGLRGVVVRIPAASLSQGRHELRVARWQRETGERDAPEDWIIPFWR